MTGIAEFLTARLDEDERAAQTVVCVSPAWWVEGDDVYDDMGIRVAVPAKWEGIATHIARNDPARVLAEVATKRRIVELHTTGSYRTYTCSNADHIQEWQCERAREPYAENVYCERCDTAPVCEELPLLAAPYADHSDFQPEWRVA